MSVLRIATRASRLALAQSGQVARTLEERLGVATELVPLKTSGDRLRDVSLAKLGGKGLFVKEIEEALLDGRADVAVHSTKDLPATLPEGLELAAFPPREDPRDALVARAGIAGLHALPEGARVGTGSVRRGAQLLAWRPDLRIEPLRGNVETRLRRLEDRGLDAVVLACAGLARLGLAGRITERIPPERVLPAVGQGALALEVRRDDPATRRIRELGDPATDAAVRAERAFLTALEGDCNVPLAALARVDAGGAVHLRALLASTDGRQCLRAEVRDRSPEKAGAAAAREVRAVGGDALLAALRAEGGA